MNLLWPVTLKKTKFNYQVIGLGIQDLQEIKLFLNTMEYNMKIGVNNIYMNGNNIQFFSDDNQNAEYVEDQRWTISICIQGYKTSLNNRSTPIWKIIQAFKY
jgi:hypothetical protein